MDILDMAEAVGSIVERIKTPTIDWKQRAINAEGIADASIADAEELEAKLSHVGKVLAECGAPTQKRAEPTRAIFITSAIDRAEWLKSKIAERGGLDAKPRSTIPEIFAIYDAALERADASRDTGAKLSSREVIHKAILAVVEHVREELAQDPVTKSVETGSSAYPIRYFNNLVSTAIGLAGGTPGKDHLFDAIANLSLERDRLRDELEAERRTRRETEERLNAAEERVRVAEAEAALFLEDRERAESKITALGEVLT